MMGRRARFRVVCATAVLGYMWSPHPDTEALQTKFYASERHAYAVSVLARGLVKPWAVAELPTGEWLVSERGGSLKHIDVRRHVSDIAGVPSVWARGQGGLFDVLLDREFAANRTLFLSYAKPSQDDQSSTLAVCRAQLVGRELRNLAVIFQANAWSSVEVHFGGRMAQDSSGAILLTVGDRHNPGDIGRAALSREKLSEHPSQRFDDHRGKILRLRADGSIPADNPFKEHRTAALVWTNGLANAQGLVVDPDTHGVLATDHGLQGGDELNGIEPGRNYGWPVIGHGYQYGSGTPAAVHVGLAAPGMESPLHVWPNTIGPSGLMLYRGTAFRQWTGSVFVGGLVAEALVRLRLDGLVVVHEERLLAGLGRVRDVRQATDGTVVVLYDTPTRQAESLVRLRPL